MFDVMKSFVSVALAIVLAIELENTTPGAGAAKKLEAVAKIREAVKPWAPAWLIPVVDATAGFLVDAIVTYANRSGFFASFASASKP